MVVEHAVGRCEQTGPPSAALTLRRAWSAVLGPASVLASNEARMCKPVLVSAIASLLGLGCATQRETGQAMVVAGAAAVIVGAQASAGHYCGFNGTCVPTRPVKGGAALAAVGAGLALAGYALTESARGDHLPLAVKPQTHAPKDWHLVRPPAPATSGDPEPGCSGDDPGAGPPSCGSSQEEHSDPGAAGAEPEPEPEQE